MLDCGSRTPATIGGNDSVSDSCPEPVPKLSFRNVVPIVRLAAPFANSLPGHKSSQMTLQNGERVESSARPSAVSAQFPTESPRATSLLLRDSESRSPTAGRLPVASCFSVDQRLFGRCIFNRLKERRSVAGVPDRVADQVVTFQATRVHSPQHKDVGVHVIVYSHNTLGIMKSVQTPYVLL